MIPCTIRSRLSTHHVLQRSVRLSQTVLSKRFYSQENKPEETDASPKEKHFWEIPVNHEHFIEQNKSVKSRMSKSAADTRDFRELLDTLFERSYAPKVETKPTPKLSKSDSVIEQKLLNLIMRNRQLYKEKAPLPRSLMAPIYGRGANTRRSNQEDEEDDAFLTGTSKHTNWHQKDIASDGRIIQRELELKSTHAIVDTNTSIELLQAVIKEINQEKYPKYYPRILTKAIEHASRKDPYLAITIFELAKRHSLNSYISGCTTKVYDAMLLLRWEAWRDVYGMLALMEEMTVNGIVFSNDSRRIVRSVVNEVEAEGNPLDQEESTSSSTAGIYWNANEKRACNTMKELAGKWIINK